MLCLKNKGTNRGKCIAILVIFSSFKGCWIDDFIGRVKRSEYCHIFHQRHQGASKAGKRTKRDSKRKN